MKSKIIHNNAEQIFLAILQHGSILCNQLFHGTYTFKKLNQLSGFPMHTNIGLQ